MHIDHVHFYVEDAQQWRNWFVHILGFQSVASGSDDRIRTEVVKSGTIYFVLSSSLASTSPVTQYLQQHPPGVVDVAFQVEKLEEVVARAQQQGAKVLQPVQVEDQPGGCLKWAQILAWGDFQHTLVERIGTTTLLPQAANSSAMGITLPQVSSLDLKLVSGVTFPAIDHIVLNVAAGELERAVSWYSNVLDFQPQQAFAIQTDYSGLCSRVMLHPTGRVQLPINEPASPNSQIQEFLDVNRGSGIQHIALRTVDIVETIAHLRQRGLSFLHVPTTYYTQLEQRPGFNLPTTNQQAIAAQEILVDWQEEIPEVMLLQAFTEPIFGQPTFFFELIERQVCQIDGQSKEAQGFGEGNFRALFEAIEREQMKRGSLR